MQHYSHLFYKHGHTTSGASIGGSDGQYWQQMKSILAAGGDTADMETDLKDVIYAKQFAKNKQWPESVAIHLANSTMKLYNKGLLNDLDSPLNLGR